MRASALALPSLEVAVGRRRAALAWRELVGVHAQAHRAAGLPPLGAGRGEDRVEALLLGLLAHPHRTRDDEHPHAVGDLASLDDFGAARRSSIRPFVHDPTNTVSTLMSRSAVPA